MVSGCRRPQWEQLQAGGGPRCSVQCSHPHGRVSPVQANIPGPALIRQAQYRDDFKAAFSPETQEFLNSEWTPESGLVTTEPRRKSSERRLPN